MGTETAVQLPGNTGRGTFATAVSEPGEEEIVDRLSCDVSPTEMDFLERFAAYRNELADAQQKKLKRRWSRKSMAEHFLKLQCDNARAQLAEMEAAIGPIPPADEPAAMKKYVIKALAYDKKSGH